MIRELLIQCPDGQTRMYPLKGDRVCLGRSSAAELCFADDAGLSRQHLALERDGNDWTVQDLGSKNGTLVNNVPLKARLLLRPGDRITAGHLVLVYDEPSGAPRQAAAGVVFFDGGDAGDSPSTSTVITSLEGALSHQTMVHDPNRGSKQINALLKAGRELAGHRPLSELFKFILDLSLEAVSAQRGMLLALEGTEKVVKAIKGEGFRISSAVCDRVINEKTSMLVRDAQLDSAFRERLSIVEQKVRTFMAVPLQTKDRIIGLIYVDQPTMFREFNKDDLSLLTVMANVAAVRIEHARLIEVEQAERLMAKELQQAADIQRGFLPAAAPRIAGADIAGYNAACRTVGGDYYDFFPYDSGRVGLVLGDVSGKGMPASLLMMQLQARVQAIADEPNDLGATMTRLNRITCQNCPMGKFITFFFAVLDPATGQLTYANAGHNPPLLIRRAGAFEFLYGGGPVLGILSSAAYTEYRTHMDAGDVLVIYSDGVSEAQDPNQDEFGEDRCAAVAVSNRDKGADQIATAVTRALNDWAGGAPVSDDITLVVAKRL